MTIGPERAGTKKWTPTNRLLQRQTIRQRRRAAADAHSNTSALYIATKRPPCPALLSRAAWHSWPSRPTPPLPLAPSRRAYPVWLKHHLLARPPSPLLLLRRLRYELSAHRDLSAVLAVAGLVTLLGVDLEAGTAALGKAVAAAVGEGLGGHHPTGHYLPFPSGLQSKEGNSTPLLLARDHSGLATQ